MIKKRHFHCQNSVFVALTCLLGLLSGTPAALGVQWTVATIAGLLQQPSSHYYHSIYGAQASLATDSSGVILRLGAFERPAFSNNDYKDQDLGFYGLIGSKLTKGKDHGLFAYLGAGKLYGYTASTLQEDKSSRNYELRGSLFAMEYQANFGSLDLCINHMQFVGSFSNDQLQSFVAWPFSFYLVSLGYRWS